MTLVCLLRRVAPRPTWPRTYITFATRAYKKPQMPVTRSSSRLTAQANSAEDKSVGRKRKSSPPDTAKSEKKTKKPKLAPKPVANSTAAAVATSEPKTGVVSGESLNDGGVDEDIPVPAVLTFDFEAAKGHLIGADARFQDLFSRMPCRPFEQLEQVHPFRALTISILGQQISWKAARSITHKFIRLYNPTIPEDPSDESREEAMNVFPSPRQVVATEVALLRTAGLSARKAEYIQDLANRFADGRLSTEKLEKASDEELADMLIQVKGIGRWTVDMFAIFSLRRPDILPVGDLGVQRGVVRWFLSQHSDAHPFGLSPEKVGSTSSKPKGKKKVTPVIPSTIEDENTVPGPGGAINIPGEADADDLADAVPTDMNNLGGETSLPPPFTPSIQKTLKKDPKTDVVLPAGLTVSVLKSRLDGKKIKGAFLTPQEMADLTECWKPYRSLGVYYMWSLAAPGDDSA